MGIKPTGDILEKFYQLTLMRELVLDITTGFDSLFNVLAFLRWQIAPGEWRHQVP